MVNAMKEQAEILKAQYAQKNNNISSLITVVSSTDSNILAENPCDSNVNTMYFTLTSSGSLTTVSGFKEVPDSENVVWIQYQPDNTTTPQYYDFYIRACWQTVGSSQNTDSAQFIVRLNK